MAPGEDEWLQSGLPSCPYRYCWRSAVYRWTPGIRIAAASYSVPGQRRMSGVVPSPVSACRSCLDYECCFGGIKLPRSDCVIQILHLHNQPDGHSYDRVCWWLVLCKTFHAGGSDFGSGSSYCHSFASVIRLVLNSNWCAGHSTLAWWIGLCNCLIFLSLLWSISEKLLGLWYELGRVLDPDECFLCFGIASALLAAYDFMFIFGAGCPG